jgi:hypothetical protein
MGSASSAKSSLDVSSTVRGKIVISFTTSFGRHGCGRGGREGEDTRMVGGWI